VLIARVHGKRPVTLVGYSMGARVIYFCLHELAKKCAAGIVENGKPSATTESRLPYHPLTWVTSWYTFPRSIARKLT